MITLLDRFPALPIWTCVAALAAAGGCSSSSSPEQNGSDESPPQTAGATALGGSAPTGGTSSTGGAVPTGGAPVAGGSTATAGSTATGGGAETGGTTATGGATASGGAMTTGGAVAAGGTAPAGGSAEGGAPAEGGTMPGGGEGGTPAEGGEMAEGGTADGGTAAVGGEGGAGGVAGTDPMGQAGQNDNGCNVRLTDTPIGYAAMDGGTVGGGDRTPINVTTEADLQAYLSDSEPRVLHVMNDLDFRTANRDGVMTCNESVPCDNGSGTLVEEPRISDSCDPQEYASTSYRYETRLNVASNKTVVGIGEGDGATIVGASFNVGSSSQVIIRNLEIRDVNPHLVEAGDGITMQGSSHVWVDHVRFADISDGHMDIGATDHSTNDNYITLSWIHFDGRTPYHCGGQHHYVNLVDNGVITYHHNFYDHGDGRNPKVSGSAARVHLFNNYWLDITDHCMRGNVDAQVRIESNYFENSQEPHRDYDGTSNIAIDDGNEYPGCSGERDTGGSVFDVPYAYDKESASDARQRVIDCAGPQPIL